MIIKDKKIPYTKWIWETIYIKLFFSDINTFTVRF